MLDVKAMARPLIPPGKSSLSSSQGTRRKGRVGGGSTMIKTPVKCGASPLPCAPGLRGLWWESGAVTFLSRRGEGWASSSSSARWERIQEKHWQSLTVTLEGGLCKREGRWLGQLPASNKRGSFGPLPSTKPQGQIRVLPARVPDLPLDKSNITATEWVGNGAKKAGGRRPTTLPAPTWSSWPKASWVDSSSELNRALKFDYCTWRNVWISERRLLAQKLIRALFIIWEWQGTLQDLPDRIRTHFSAYSPSSPVRPNKIATRSYKGQSTVCTLPPMILPKSSKIGTYYYPSLWRRNSGFKR